MRRRHDGTPEVLLSGLSCAVEGCAVEPGDGPMPSQVVGTSRYERQASLPALEIAGV